MSVLCFVGPKRPKVSYSRRLKKNLWLAGFGREKSANTGQGWGKIKKKRDERCRSFRRLTRCCCCLDADAVLMLMLQRIVLPTERNGGSSVGPLSVTVK